MSSYLFLGAVVGMVLLAYWAYQNDLPGAQGSRSGIFGMRDSLSEDADKPRGFVPKWKQNLNGREDP